MRVPSPNELNTTTLCFARHSAKDRLVYGTDAVAIDRGRPSRKYRAVKRFLALVGAILIIFTLCMKA